MVNRRNFLYGSAAGAAGLLLTRGSGFAATSSANASRLADAHIEILLDEPLGTISSNIYGHFTENLGGVLYDGMWVGRGSKIPNIDGLRKELIDEMRKIKAPVVRFPGGCFADGYDWQDGVGPADKRPRRTNFWAGSVTNGPDVHKYDPNQVGTDEFVQFCKLCGAEPYLAANVRSLPAQSFWRWVEYCNSAAGTTSLADLRASGGHSDPYGVKYWGVGNESWGCGGSFTPQEYAVEFRRYSEWLPQTATPLSLIASGPNSDEFDWTRGFLEELVRKGSGMLDRVYGMALHHYAWNLSRGKTGDWDSAKGDALQFDAIDWYELLREGERMEGLINGHWQVMSEIDRKHHIKLIVDEWGPWYKPGSEMTPGDIIEQTPTLRDAIFSGMTLDIFNRHPEKVAMANCAQLINCLNSLYLAHEDRFVVTPVGHVFALYASHQGGEGLRTIFSSPQVHYDRDGKPATFWGLKGSASRIGKEVTLTVVNPHVSEALQTEISLRGATVKSGTVTTLSHTDIHAHNTFAQRDVVAPKTSALRMTGNSLVLDLDAASVTAIRVTVE